ILILLEWSLFIQVCPGIVVLNISQTSLKLFTAEQAQRKRIAFIGGVSDGKSAAVCVFVKTSFSGGREMRNIVATHVLGKHITFSVPFHIIAGIVGACRDIPFSFFVVGRDVRSETNRLFDVVIIRGAGQPSLRIGYKFEPVISTFFGRNINQAGFAVGVEFGGGRGDQFDIFHGI